MYKIYINENELLLANSEKIKSHNHPDKVLLAPYLGKKKMLFNYIDLLEKSDESRSIILHYPDKKKLKTDFLSLYKIVKASGGLVKNNKDEFLMIHRRGYWDLPKGKIDAGEKKKQAALREVEEETGVTGLELKKKICVTDHSYKLKNGARAIKRTYWYKMYAPNQKLTPQIEEDIEMAEWMTLDQVREILPYAYGSIRSVFKKNGLL